MPESDDQIFRDLPSIGEGAIGGVWNAEFHTPRPYGHRSNHEDWHGQFFATPDSPHRQYVAAAADIGDAYGEPTAPGRDDNIVLPGHAYNCQCSMRLIYELDEVPWKNLTRTGRKAKREGWWWL